MRKILVFISALVVLGFVGYTYWDSQRPDTHPTVDVEEVRYEEIVPEEESTPEEVAEEPDDEPVEVEETVPDESPEESSGLPSEFNLAVPFTSQAPYSNWDLPYQEACEEASMFMVSEYYKGTVSGKIDPAVADAGILDIVAFEEDFLGMYLDTTANETAQVIDFYYDLTATVIEDPTIEQIKAEIAAGRPVIVPAAGRELGNPNFTGIGPLYHMFVIKGYTEDKFITNDPGTRNGESYVYDISVIMDAMGDWNNGDPANGAKRVIFVSP